MEHISPETKHLPNGNLTNGDLLNRNLFKSSDPHELSNNNNSSLTSHFAASDGGYIPIPQLYAGRCVFITGGSGFVGKVLVEKLLRSCPDIKVIYLLIRTKRGKAVPTRLTELLNVSLFDTLRRENPKQLNKVIPISGDITMEELGISKSDQAILCRNVSIVFHSAATVRFDEKLKLSVVINILGTKRLIELCHRMKSLDALIHVSTAYSNCDRAEVSEIIYDAPYKPDDIISLINILPEDMLDDLTPSLIGKHPNTYTFTKALAEHMLLKESGSLPIAIVRPSIVTASLSEPVPGWVDNLNGATGLVAAIGNGLFRSIICQADNVADLVPVDIVVNLMISAAWRTATNKSNHLSIYNCCTGQRHPLRWGEFIKSVTQQLRENPFESCLWYPDVNIHSNRLMNTVHSFLVHFVPAYGLDTLLRVMGKQLFFVRNQKKLYKASEEVNFFTTNQWLFKDENVHDLFTKMKQPDRKTFVFNVCSIDWAKCVKMYMLGIREFLFKQQPESLPASRKRLKRLYYLNKLMKWLTVTFTGSFVMMNWSPINNYLNSLPKITIYNNN